MNTKKLSERIDSVRNSRYSIAIYVATVFAFTILLILVGLDLCLLSMILAVLAILIPLKFYKEPNFKKVVAAGALSILIMALVGTVFHVHILYSQEPAILESDTLLNGSVDGIYGDTSTIFNFTVEVGLETTVNHTVYLNLTYTGDDGASQMSHHEMTSMEGDVYFFATSLEERQYLYHFTLGTTVDNETTWETTPKGFGPLVISERTAFVNIFIMRLTSPVIIFFLFVSLLWWKRGLEESRRSSTKGLDEKESALDDSCPECGALMDGRDICPDCGHGKGGEDHTTKKDRIKCPDCRHLIVTDNESCPYCGADVR